MFIEELRLVKNSEKDAEQIKVDGKKHGTKLKNQATSKAFLLVEEAEKEGVRITKQLIAQGELEAIKQYDKHMDNERIKSKELINQARGRKDEAISLIAERIVRASVNS